MSAVKRTPTKREPRKDKIKVIEKTLSSNTESKKALLKPHQKPIANFLRENNISIILGEAGCAKDFVQMFRALEGLQSGEFKRLVITKPIVELGRSVGFLPGSEEDKFSNYEKSFYDSIYKIAGKDNVPNIRAKMSFDHIGFQRGNTFPEYSVIILSEAQNMTLHELISYVTRLPLSSKLFINADPLQSDIGRSSGLNDFLIIMKSINGVGIVELDPDIHQMRNPMIIEINRNYRKFLNGK